MAMDMEAIEIMEGTITTDMEAIIETMEPMDTTEIITTDIQTTSTIDKEAITEIDMAITIMTPLMDHIETITGKTDTEATMVIHTGATTTTKDTDNIHFKLGRTEAMEGTELMTTHQDISLAHIKEITVACLWAMERPIKSSFENSF